MMSRFSMILGMQAQLYTGLYSPAWLPIKNSEFPWHKPYPGTGLWTSTYLGEKLGSDWVQWCIYNDFWRHVAHPTKQQGWLLHPKKDARIFVVDNQEDAKSLAHAYSPKLPKDWPLATFIYIDFEKMAADYDAIHLTLGGERATRLTMNHSLYGWDCESTIWFRDVFEKMEYLGWRKYTVL
jgi:hypothetical protein